MRSKLMIFQMRELTNFLKASRFTLNRLMLRCDIETSVGSRVGRGGRMLYAVEDVCKLGVAYWMFRSGMRTPAIKDALANKELRQFLQELGDINAAQDAATRLEFLISWRVVKGKTISQEVKLEADIDGVKEILESERQFGFVVIPIRQLLTQLTDAIWKHVGVN